MIALIVSEDQNFQQSLSELLRRLDYLTIYTADSIDEADYFLNREQKKIKLVLFESSPKQGIDTPLSRLLIQKTALNLTTLIHVSNHSRVSPFSISTQDQLSRVDGDLSKPFGIRQLKKSIQSAQRRRASIRNKILIIGSKHNNNAVESMYTHQTLIHWKNIFSTNELSEFKKYFDEFQFRIGGIIVDPQFNSPDVISYLNHFKKTTQGSLTPIAILSKNPLETIYFREFGDLYFNPTDIDWGEILETISQRLIYQGDVIDVLHEAKKLIKKNKTNKAKKVVETSLVIDPKRWELLELLGKINETLGNHSKSIDNYKKSLLNNPCTPSVYLHLVNLLKNSEKKEIIIQGKSFCPFHPQIKLLEINE